MLDEKQRQPKVTLYVPLQYFTAMINRSIPSKLMVMVWAGFLIRPQVASKYYVRFLTGQTRYVLPTVIPDGPALYASKALANDTLSVTLFDNKPEKLFLLVHDYKQLYSAMPITMNTANKRVKVLLNDVPKGLAQITITDSLGRPFIQRTFFAHYNRRSSMQVNTNESEYTTREKVNVKIKLKTPLDTLALVSIACVQDNRIEAKKKNDIETYFYLKTNLGELPVKESYISNAEADTRFLENVLLIKGWTKYKWTDVLKAEKSR